MTATWLLLAANGLLCVITFWVSWKQAHDFRKRDRVSAEREAKRLANKIILTTSRLQNIANEVPGARDRLHRLLHQGGMPATVKEETAKKLEDWNKRLSEMQASAIDLLAIRFSSMSDSQLTEWLWRLDSFEEQANTLRDVIAADLAKYEAESRIIQDRDASMQAAALNAHLSKPLKSKLGE